MPPKGKSCQQSMPNITLHCGIIGDLPNTITGIEIASSAAVSILAQAILCQNEHLKCSDSKIRLWAVSFLDILGHHCQ